MKYLAVLLPTRDARLANTYAVERVEMIFSAHNLDDAKNAATAFCAYALPTMNVNSVTEIIFSDSILRANPVTELG
jgi:hypothetical protein